MKSRERKYLQFKRLKTKFGFISYPLSKKSFFAHTGGEVFSNYGIFIPEGIARNDDGTPRQVNREFQWADRNGDISVSPVGGSTVTITITKDNFNLP